MVKKRSFEFRNTLKNWSLKKIRDYFGMHGRREQGISSIIDLYEWISRMWGL